MQNHKGIYGLDPWVACLKVRCYRPSKRMQDTTFVSSGEISAKHDMVGKLEYEDAKRTGIVITIGYQEKNGTREVEITTGMSEEMARSVLQPGEEYWASPMIDEGVYYSFATRRCTLHAGYENWNFLRGRSYINETSNREKLNDIVGLVINDVETMSGLNKDAVELLPEAEKIKYLENLEGLLRIACIDLVHDSPRHYGKIRDDPLNASMVILKKNQ